VVNLVRPSNRDSDVASLIVGELGEFDTESLEVKSGDLLV
jgi:hypothetical protein